MPPEALTYPSRLNPIVANAAGTLLGGCGAGGGGTSPFGRQQVWPMRSYGAHRQVASCEHAPQSLAAPHGLPK